MAIRLHVWGERACFIRPEFKVERVSYDIITPMAARGILEAIHWKPALRWQVDRIHILNPIEFEPVYVESPQKGGPGQRRAAIILRNVSYVIEARLTLTEKAGSDDNLARHYKMFCRRAARGMAFQPPSLGMPEFAADFSLIDDDKPIPPRSFSQNPSQMELGWLLYDIDYEKGRLARYFRASIVDGSVSIPPAGSPELAA